MVFFIANKTYCPVLILSISGRQTMLCGITEIELIQRDNSQPYVSGEGEGDRGRIKIKYSQEMKISFCPFTFSKDLPNLSKYNC
jgi:hypothetical protein